MEKKKKKECLPDNLNTLPDKIQYVKDVYGLNDEKGNLIEWLIKECKNDKKIDIEEIKSLLIYGKEPCKNDGINYYSYDWEEICEIAENLKNNI